MRNSIEIEIIPGDHLYLVTRKMVAIASNDFCVVKAKFNGCQLICVRSRERCG